MTDDRKEMGRTYQPPKKDDKWTDDEYDMLAQSVVHTFCCWLSLFVAFALVVLICMIFDSCATTDHVTEHTIVRTDTVYQTKQVHDSIYMLDSVYAADYTRGDTVWRIRDRWRTQYVERWRVDTLKQTTTDTLVVTHETVRVEPRPRTGGEQMCERVGVLSIFAIILFVLRKVYLSLRRKH